jgi:hypothetical protein
VPLFSPRLRAIVILMLAAATSAFLATSPATAATPSTAAANPNSIAPKVSSKYCGADIWAVTITPAKGFNPVTASAGQLEANGYAQKPSKSNARAYAQWRSTSIAHPGTKGSCVLHKGHARSASAALATPQKLANWAGYIANGVGIADFGQAEGTWDYPLAQPVNATVGNPNGIPVYSSTWVGIGLGGATIGGTADPKYPLIQAGSESDSGSSETQENYLWFQVVPEEKYQEMIPDVYPGPSDAVGVHITWTSGGQVTGCGNAACTNPDATCTVAGTVSQCALIHITDGNQHLNREYEVGGYWPHAGQEAEWIYERTTEANVIPALADAPTNFSLAEAIPAGAQAWSTLTQLESTFPVTPYNMYNCGTNGGAELASVSSPSGSSFDVTWHAPGTANFNGC